MEQFSLEKYLENPSRKVVTRRGNSVRIICTDRKHGEDDLPIVFLEESNGGEFLLTCKSNGRDGSNKDYDTQYDLFFADEEEGLTEFDYAVLSIISDHNSHTDSIEDFAKRSSKKLLDLARKKLESERDRTCEEAVLSQVYDEGYEQGKQDILKDLPKWKKATEDKDFDRHVLLLEDDRVVIASCVYEDEYYIELNNLRTLPKEE